jgi:hypothetical protein
VAEFFRIGLIAFEIVQRRLQDVAGSSVRADDVDGVADGVHRLFEDKDLVFLGKVADEHENFLAGHAMPPPLICLAGRQLGTSYRG